MYAVTRTPDFQLLVYSLLAAQSWFHTTSQIGKYNSDSDKRKRIWPFAQAQDRKGILERIPSEEVSFIVRKTTKSSIQIADVMAEILNDFLTKRKKMPVLLPYNKSVG